MKNKLLEGYFDCLLGLASTGNNFLADHIIESKHQFDYLAGKLNGVDTFLVGFTLPDRRIGAKGTDPREPFNR